MLSEIVDALEAETDTLQRLYCQEIERVIAELDSLLGRLCERIDATATCGFSRPFARSKKIEVRFSSPLTVHSF